MPPISCRWGILSTANIARKNWQAIRRSGNGRVVAVASRDARKAQQFIDDCQSQQPFDPTPLAIGSYEELLTRRDIDAVYIPLPTGLRKEWVLKAAAAGKHVLCEKPCATSTTDLAEMIAACERAHVQFMDGVMFMHSARLPLLKSVLADGATVGEIRRIASQFSFRAQDEFLAGNIRVSSALEPHGCLGDLGWYTIRFSLWVQDFALPREVTGRILSQHGRADSPEAVPTEFSGELHFANGVSAGFYNSFLTQNQQWANVSGSAGYVELNDFVLPWYGAEVTFRSEQAEFEVDGCDFRMARRSRSRVVDEFSNSHPTAQESRMFRLFGEIVASGQTVPHWPRIALQTQRVMDACLESARQGSRPVQLGG